MKIYIVVEYQDLEGEISPKIFELEVEERTKTYRAERTNWAFDHNVLIRKDDPHIAPTPLEAIQKYMTHKNREVKSLERRIELAKQLLEQASALAEE